MSCHHIGKKSDHQREGLSEDAEELNERHQGYGHLEPRGHMRPEDVFPISLRSCDVGDDERAKSQEEREGDITCEVASSGRERNHAHDIGNEDEEETGEEVRRI